MLVVRIAPGINLLGCKRHISCLELLTGPLCVPPRFPTPLFAYVSKTLPGTNMAITYYTGSLPQCPLIEQLLKLTTVLNKEYLPRVLIIVAVATSL